MKENKVNISLFCKPSVVLRTNTIDAFQKEIQRLLNKYFDIDVDNFPNELPPLPNKDAYRMTLKENDKIRKQVKELLDKVLVNESLSPCAIPSVLAPKKYGS